MYEFFTNALSVFESFGYCLYVVGHATTPSGFALVENSNFKGINLKATEKAFTSAFPHAAITTELAKLQSNQGFQKIDEFRNILAHRLAGGRGSSGSSVLHADGSSGETSEEWFYVHGAKTTLQFDEQLFERELNPMGALVRRLADASCSFVENIPRAKGQHGN